MKNKYILFFIIFVLILIWFFLLYNIRNNNIESFTSSDNIYAKNKILNNCNLTWGKKNKNQGLCNSSSWVSDPNLLCGICGLDHNNPLYFLKDNDGSTLYGCNENNPNPYQLSWNSKGIQTTKVNEVVSNILTCNSYNSNTISDMMLFICFDDYCSISINGKVITNQSGWNTQGIYNYKNIKYGDNVKIVGTNVCAPGGLALSYIWNKQLFILDNNGFEKSANIIDYIATGATGWDRNTWASGMSTIPLWMKNFMTCQYCNSCSGCKTQLTLEFKIGHTKQSQLNNDINMFLGIDDYGIVNKNGVQVYNKNQSWNNIVNIVIPNVNENDIIDIKCYNGAGPGGIGVLYLWYGFIFSFPQNSISGFNNCVNLINIISSTNNTINTYNYTANKDGAGYFNLMPTWLYTTNSIGNFSIKFKITFSSLDFKLSGVYTSVPSKDDTNQVSIINTNNVTMYNDPVRGNVFNFNSKNYLTIGLTTGVNFTRSAWAYFNSTSSPSNNVFSSILCPLWYMGGDYINASWNWGAGNQYIKDNQNRKKQWTHYIITYDNSNNTFSMFVNGDLIKSQVLGKNAWNGDNGTHWIGGYGGGNNWYGYISDIEQYNIALSSQQIKDLYNSQKK